MGLTRNFHGKKGGPWNFFAVWRGAPKIFCDKYLHQAPLQVFVNDPLRHISARGESHMEVTGMCGHDPKSRGLSVSRWQNKYGVFQWGQKKNRGSFGEDYKKGVF